MKVNVLILTGKFGMGHYSVANSLSAQIQKECVDAKVTTKDMLQCILPAGSANAIYETFNVLVNYGSNLYNVLYKYSAKSKIEVRIPVIDFLAMKLDKLLNATRPDIIISTVPLCSQVVAAYKSRYHYQVPLITCITDISTHPDWVCFATDYYLVASESVKNSLLKQGVPADIIFVVGIPVKPEFKENIPVKASSKRKILIMGGGLGLLPKSVYFYEAINRLDNVQTTIITGRNKKLYRKLHGKYANIEVIGYTDKVHEYMHNADLIISKPGGITLYETIFSELPILAFRPFLQQEIHNSEFILNNHIGMVLPKKPKECAEEIANLVNDEVKLNQIRNNMHTLKNQINNIGIADILYYAQTKGKCA